MFEHIKNIKYGAADINILYDIKIDENGFYGEGNFNQLTVYPLFFLAGAIPVVAHSGDIRSNIRISHNNRSQSYDLLDRYEYWVSIPSLILGFASGSLYTFPKFSESLVKRTIELLEASDLFESAPRWEPKPDTISPDLIVDLHSKIPKAKARKRNAIAVVIGNSNYQKPDIPDVKYAISDANLVAKYLQVSLGFLPENIIYLENATLSDFRTIFGDENNPNGRLSSYIMDDNSEVFIYYQGHGAPNLTNQSAYLVPVDADPDRISLSGYAVDLLYGNLSKLNVNSYTVLLDACFSGASGDGKMLIKNASPVFLQADVPSQISANSIVITASSGSQIASWFNDARHSILTYQFLVGLRGDADLNSDGKISLKEMKDFLQNRWTGVPYLANRLYGREQMPQIWGNESKIILAF